MSPSLPSQVAKAGVASGAVAAARDVGGTFVVSANTYAVVAVALALVGVLLARMVSVNEENRRLGRRQDWRETGPLTWIGVLIVCPFIWHFQIAIPWASFMGLGTGYSVRVILRIFGAGAAGAARAMVRDTVESLSDIGVGSTPPSLEDQRHIDTALKQLDHVERIEDKRPRDV